MRNSGFISSVITTLALSSLFVSCAPKFYSLEDYSKTKKIDSHVHIYSDRGDFVEQARKDNFQLISIALDQKGTWEALEEQHKYCMWQAKQFPETVFNVTAFSMEGWDEAGWLEKSMTFLQTGLEEGAVGVKVWKNIGMEFKDRNGDLVMIDDPKLDPIFQMLADRNTTLIGHLGEPQNCWLPLSEMTTNNDSSYFARHPEYHMHLHPEHPSYEDQVDHRDRLLSKNPNLTFVGAHLGSMEWSVDTLASRLDKYPQMSVDMAARMGQLFYQTHFDRQKVRNFFVKYQDRLLYATDLSDGGTMEPDDLKHRIHEVWTRDWRFLATDQEMTSDLVDVPFQGLQLPKQVIDMIFYHNAVKWFKLVDEGT